eukprot:snap_masked-scaffold_6-processed-gene-5.41-mRNA-1 protein AED:1.00 eAED:1.00 QI:0/-1/0/0/-1/1/1/0/367
MKVVKTLFGVCLSMVALINAEGSVDTLASQREFTVAQKVQVVRALGVEISKSKANIMELASNPQVVNTIQKALRDNRVVTKEDVRDLQIQQIIDIALEIFNFIQESCPQEIEDFTIFDLIGSAEALLTCVQDSFVNVIEGCVNSLVDLADPLRCLVNLGLSEADMDLIPSSEFDLDSSNQAELRRLVQDRELQIGSSESTGEFNEFWEDVNQIVDDLIEVDQETCEFLYGTGDDPSFFGCLSLFDGDFFTDLGDFLEDFLPGEECETLARITGLNDIFQGVDLFSTAIFGLFDIFQDESFADSTQDSFDAALENFGQVFSECDVIANGELSSTIDAEFRTSTPSSGEPLAVNALPSFVLALIVNLLN